MVELADFCRLANVIWVRMLKIFIYLLLYFDRSYPPLYSFRTFKFTLKLFNTTYHFLGYSKHSSKIFELSAVIGCWEYSKQFPTIEKFISFLYNLMWSTYKIQAIIIKKLIDNLRSIDIAYPSLEIAIPAFIYLLRVWP